MSICNFIFDISNDENFKSFIENVNIINIILLFDIDIVVVFIHLLYFTLFINGNSVINELRKDGYYLILRKIYYCLLLIVNPTILYIFYQSESIIVLEHFNIALFFLICSFILIIVCIIIHTGLQIPLKKIN